MSFEQEEQYDYLVKTFIIGKKGVGKTTFMKLLNPPSFKFDYNTQLTIGVDFYFYDYSFKSNNINKSARFQIWICNLESRFKQIVLYYLCGSLVILLMFDVSNLNSLKEIDEWIELIKKQSLGDLPILLLGNKADLTEHLESAKLLADSIVDKHHLLGYLEISALKSSNLEIIIDTIAKTVLQRFEPNFKKEN